ADAGEVDLDLDLLVRGRGALRVAGLPAAVARPARGARTFALRLGGLLLAVDVAVGVVLLFRGQGHGVELGGGAAGLADVRHVAPGRVAEPLAGGRPDGGRVAVDVLVGDAPLRAAVGGDDVDVRQERGAGPGVRPPLAVRRPLRAGDRPAAEGDDVA